MLITLHPSVHYATLPLLTTPPIPSAAHLFLGEPFHIWHLDVHPEGLLTAKEVVKLSGIVTLPTRILAGTATPLHIRCNAPLLHTATCNAKR
jgi:hypothetical protein